MRANLDRPEMVYPFEDGLRMQNAFYEPPNLLVQALHGIPNNAAPAVLALLAGRIQAVEGSARAFDLWVQRNRERITELRNTLMEGQQPPSPPAEYSPFLRKS